MRNPGILYVVSVPIGNPGDITLRAMETLQTVDVVVVEDMRTGTTLFKRINVTPKSIVVLNEHNEKEQSPDLALRMVNGESFALTTDCGTPVFSDPGHGLIREAINMGIRISPIPGASSLMSALSVLDFQPEQFFFAGFLPRVPDQRRKALMDLKNMRVPIILMDTPYRLASLLEDVAKVFGKGLNVTLACDLTQPSEIIFRGAIGDVQRQVQSRKAEFILVLQLNPAHSGRR